MIIKKFLGKTEEEAKDAAKKELGEGLVVMNVRQVKPKGLFAIFKAKQIEVTVALEDDIDAMRVPVREPERDAVKQIAKVVAEKEAQNAATPDQSSIEKKLDSLQNLLENQIKKQEEAEKEEQAVTEKEAVAETSEKKDSAEKEETPKDEEQEKFVRLLYNTMIENEVDEKYANQILEDVDKSRKPNMPFDYILANIYQKIILKFDESNGIGPAKEGPKVVFFIGPTGVGKTTTIAKLASSYAMEEHKKVALLTADTYRIAAAEQLRTYAQILEVPFRVIYEPRELCEAVESFKDYDFIFVDTAGHSHQNEDQLDKMKEYLDALQDRAEVQSFLVLSATTKYKDLLKIADNYKAITSYQLIFTKLDETTTLGNLLNVKLHVDTPIAYITYGQNVPNDIEKFDPQKTVKQLLGGKA